MFSRKKLLFFSVLAGCFILMTYQSRQVRSIAGNRLSWVLYRAQDAAQRVGDAAASPFRKMALRDEEITSLRKQLDRLQMERDRYQEAFRENKRLRELLKFRESHSDYSTSARVVARGIDRWSNMLVLDKGARDGVQKDMTAVTPKGLAGKITDVSDSYANLLLVTDINFSAAVRIQESRKEGVLSGTGNRECVLKYIPYEDEVKTGDVIVTSGLDSLFPPGIPVGFVSAVDTKGKGGQFQHIEVTPYQDGSSVEEVIIGK
jgi:rod shape-determining protein MreC